MNKRRHVFLYTVTMLTGIGLGVWFSDGQKNSTPHVVVSGDREIAYYRDPMESANTSPEPKQDSMGMDYIAVYKDELKAGQGTASKIVYYRNPMGLPDTSLVPKKDPMGMDYVAVFEGEENTGKLVKLSPDKVQKLGVTVSDVSLRALQRIVRAVGVIEPNERKLHTIAPRFMGWIETLYVNETGQQVKRGQPLFDIYSPDLVSAQREYLLAIEAAQIAGGGDASAQQLTEGALERLRNWQVGNDEIERLVRAGKPLRTLVFRSPADGVVLEKMATEGMRFMPGEPLFKLADLRTVWLIAEVFEQDMPFVKIGQTVSLTTDAFPGEVFEGRVTFIYPTLNDTTRTAKLRIELPNDPFRLRPGMYGRASIVGGDSSRVVTAIPNSSVLDSGTRRIVLVQKGVGLYEPREVKTGMRADDYVEVTEGVAVGERVVTRANFLIDAESNLKSAFGDFGHAAHASNPPPVTNDAARIKQKSSAPAALKSGTLTDVTSPLPDSVQQTTPVTADPVGVDHQGR